MTIKSVRAQKKKNIPFQVTKWKITHTTLQRRHRKTGDEKYKAICPSLEKLTAGI